jgi:hypothetical protein
MKTNELTGAALDWAVAKCEGATDEWRADGPFWWGGVPCIRSGGHDVNYTPSTDWAQGGPIIDREDIAMSSKPDGLWAAYAPKGTRLVQHGGQAVEVFNWTYKQQGYTPLIAAMRCYVASKLGSEVEVPDDIH